MHPVRQWISLLVLVPLAACGQPLVKESSGLAAGSDGLVWTHSDGPNIGERSQDRNLYALDAEGALVRVAKLGVRNNDWEDMASFILEGRRYLLIADVGDNLARRTENQIYVVEEPKGDNAPLAWKIRFRYPDQPHDCEAVAVDVERERILLVTKRDTVPQIYELPLRGSEEVQTASRVGTVFPLHRAQGLDVLVHPFLAPFAHQPTALDISADNRRAALLTYREAYLWRRAPEESWAQALGRSPDATLAIGAMRQYEGVAFAASGESLMVSQEGRNGFRIIALPRD